MHVLLVCHAMRLGGAERYTMDLANSLTERGVKVTVAFGGPVLHKPGFADEVEHLEINVVRGHIGLFRIIVDLPVGKRLYSYIRDSDVDIVNTMMMDSGFWCWLAGRYLKVPCLQTQMHVFGNYGGPERFLFGSRVGAKILQFLRLDFLAMSDYYAWELANIGKIPTSSIHQATMGIDLNKFKPKVADDKVREELGLGHGPVIGVVARLQRVKGCHKIIAAMPTALQICPETQLLIVGDGPQRQALEDQAKELGVEDNVIFTGWRTDTLEMNAQMDVYIQTTDGPNLGLSPLQAMSQAKAQVVFTEDELEEKMAHDTVQEGVNGHVVPTNEPRKAGEIIGKMLTDRQKLKKMGLASRRLAEEKFDWDLHVSKVIEIYQELIDKNRDVG